MDPWPRLFLVETEKLFNKEPHQPIENGFIYLWQEFCLLTKYADLCRSSHDLQLGGVPTLETIDLEQIRVLNPRSAETQTLSSYFFNVLNLRQSKSLLGLILLKRWVLCRRLINFKAKMIYTSKPWKRGKNHKNYLNRTDQAVDNEPEANKNIR